MSSPPIYPEPPTTAHLTMRDLLNQLQRLKELPWLFETVDCRHTQFFLDILRAGNRLGSEPAEGIYLDTELVEIELGSICSHQIARAYDNYCDVRHDVCIF